MITQEASCTGHNKLANLAALVYVHEGYGQVGDYFDRQSRSSVVELCWPGRSSRAIRLMGVAGVMQEVAWQCVEAIASQSERQVEPSPLCELPSTGWTTLDNVGLSELERMQYAVQHCLDNKEPAQDKIEGCK
jgi:hypothetical protein